MGKQTLLLTGFEPFLDVKVNASGEVAKLLHGTQVAGVEIHSAILPVTFRSIPGAYAEALGACEPLALCSMGVQREPYFRIERRARPDLSSSKPDEAGEYAGDQEPLGPCPMETGVDLESLAQALRGAGARDVRISDDAGGYVCERCYWELLQTAQERALPGVFLHLPPVDGVPVDEQLPVVRALLERLLRPLAGAAPRE